MSEEIIISIVMIIILIGLAYITKDLTVSDSVANEERFTEIGIYEYTKIVYDKQTNVIYAVSDGPYNRGNFIVLVDKEGKPLTYKEAE